MRQASGDGSTFTRRELIRRSAAVGAVAWTAPVILDSMVSPAAAASGGCGPCKEPSGIRIIPGEKGDFTCSAIVFEDTCPVIQKWIEGDNGGKVPPWDDTCPPKSAITVNVLKPDPVTWEVILPKGCRIATVAEGRLIAAVGGFCDAATIEARDGECGSDYIVTAPKDTLPFLDLVYCCIG